MDQYLMKATYVSEGGQETVTRYRIIENPAEVVSMIEDAGWEAFLIVENGNATALRPVTLNTAQELRDVVTLNDGVGDIVKVPR